MFAARKKTKAVAVAKAIIVPLLSQLQSQPFRASRPIGVQPGADPYLIGFIHNIVR